MVFWLEIANDKKKSNNLSMLLDNKLKKIMFYRAQKDSNVSKKDVTKTNCGIYLFIELIIHFHLFS